MATFFIDDTGVVTTASTGGDSIYIQSAAVKGQSILGLAGNDTINLTEGVVGNNSAFGMEVKAGEGNDEITISGLGAFSAGKHTIIGGAGSDTINMSGSTLDQLKTNGGADKLVLSGGSYSAIGLGAGSDSITISAADSVTAHAYRLSLGDGHDLVVAGSTLEFNTAASVIGGNGRDTINLAIGAGSQSAAFINGGALQDVITIDGLIQNQTVKGMGGADTITLSGDGQTSAFIAAGAGADKVTLSGMTLGSTIAGGEGADSIAIMGITATVSADILGGSGADSIAINAPLTAQNISKTTIAGGAGADTITFSAGNQTGTTTLGTLAYSSFTESDLANTDTVDINVVPTSGALVKFTTDFTDDLTSLSITEAAAAVSLGDATFSGNIASNTLTVSGSYSVSSVTALAGTVDTITLDKGKGAAVLISAKGGANYLFVQGGTTGTADDAVISLGSLSGASVSVGTAATFTISGVI